MTRSARAADPQSGLWQPLLEGELRAQALEVVAAIADSLRELTQSSPEDAALSPSLAGGAPGLAILFSYLSQTRSESSDASRAANLLDHAIRKVADNPADAGLYSGLAGVGWAAAHLRLPGGEDVNDEIDERWPSTSASRRGPRTTT
jgi:hypothetical protein